MAPLLLLGLASGFRVKNAQCNNPISASMLRFALAGYRQPSCTRAEAWQEQEAVWSDRSAPASPARALGRRCGTTILIKKQAGTPQVLPLESRKFFGRATGIGAQNPSCRLGHGETLIRKTGENSIWISIDAPKSDIQGYPACLREWF